MREFDYNGHKVLFDKEKQKLTGVPGVSMQRVLAKLNYILRSEDKTKKKMLNIGCGFRPFVDFINLDYNKEVWPDVVRDIEKGLPFEDNRFEAVYSSHVIEHVKDVFFFMSEIWRVTKNKGQVIIIAPYCGYLDWAIQPDHLRLINYNYFSRWQPEYNSVQDELKQIKEARFKILETKLINEAREIRFLLEVVKNGMDK